MVVRICKTFPEVCRIKPRSSSRERESERETGTIHPYSYDTVRTFVLRYGNIF